MLLNNISNFLCSGGCCFSLNDIDLKRNDPMPTLGIFVKQPVPGIVKTRLGAKIGMEQAAQLYEAFQHDILESTSSIDCQRVIAFAPNTEEAKSWFKKRVIANDKLWPQPDVSLGERLSVFFEQHLATDDRVIVIGSDSPTIPMELIKSGLEALKQKDIVLGPAVDGGYYLVGQRNFCPEMFQQIDWSGPNVLSQTVDRIRESNRSLALLPPWYDVDSLDDLRFLDGHLKAIGLAQSEEGLPQRTRQLVPRLISQSDDLPET